MIDNIEEEKNLKSLVQLDAINGKEKYCLNCIPVNFTFSTGFGHMGNCSHCGGKNIRVYGEI